MELEDLIKSVDIVDYISRYVELEQRGDEWWGLSPFTNEKTPSFSVRESTGKWFDFSSGRGGNVFSFIKQYLSYSTSQAIDELKRVSGFEGDLDTPNLKLGATSVCKKYSKPKVQPKQSTATILPDNYMEKYERNLEKMKVWIDEGISLEVLDICQVRYDSFSNRLVYPIRNLDGKIVNVGGRTLDPNWKEKGLRKYCYFFQWGTIDTIYGLVENIQEIQEKKEVILFEGCKSVLLAKTWGVGNTGAILTSHLSANQMKILAKLGKSVVFALDNEVDIRQDRNINKLKRYCNVSYIKDIKGLLGEKDSPVDKGKEVFEELYNHRYIFR